MAVALLSAGIAAGADDDNEDKGDSGAGNVKSMRVQKIQLNRDKSEPRDVFSWFEITLKDINVPSQTFSCSIEVHLFWQDFNLPNIFPEFETEDFSVDDDDVPVKMSEIFENKLSCDLEGDPVFQYYKDTGTIYMMFVVECTFVERMELQRFPLDRQFLNMEFNAWVEEGNWVWTLQPGLEWVPEDFRNRKFAVRMVSSITEYQLLGPWIDFTTEQPLSIRLRVNRVPTYYFGNIVFPNFLIVAGCITSFAVPYTDVADRLSVTVTLMLAAVAFRFVVSTMLPKVAYLTIMDIYLLIGFFALILLIGENSIAGVESLADYAVMIDWIFGLIFTAFWLLIHVVCLVASMNENFYRVTWEEMDRIDSEEDPDAEFVKADPKHTESPDESEFCKDQWAQIRLKSPTTRAQLFEMAHPDIAEKNRSQNLDDAEDQGDNKTKGDTDNVPSKVPSKIADDDLVGAMVPSKVSSNDTKTNLSNAITISKPDGGESPPAYTDGNVDPNLNANGDANKSASTNVIYDNQATPDAAVDSSDAANKSNVSDDYVQVDNDNTYQE